jgi:hypothetical protein
MTPDDPRDQTIFTPPVNAAPDPHLPTEKAAKPAQPEQQHPLFYTQEDESDLHLPLIDEQDQPVESESPFVLPFQNSAAMPTIPQMDVQGPQRATGGPSSAPSPGSMRRSAFPLVRLLLIASVVLVTVLGASFFVFAQSAAPASPTHVNGTPGSASSAPTQGPAAKNKTSPSGSSRSATVSSSSTPSTQGNHDQGQATQGTGTGASPSVPSAQFLRKLGWTQAGLSFGDALEVLRTGTTFTDREMSYDFRNIGTPANHGGTLTGATFLLTPGGKIRFTHNDVRAINNVLYDKIRNGKIVQQVVNAQPSLVQFQIVQVQGQQHKFAWVNVAFELFQSKIDPASGKRVESLVLNPTTGQPLVHHMVVVLVWVSPQNQGANAPMGGTGWLVDTYALDAHTLPGIAIHPSL